MGRNGNEGDLVLLRTIVPEDPVGRRRGLFGVGLKDLCSARPFQAGEFMGLQTGMPWVRGQEADRFGDGFVALLPASVPAQLTQLLLSLVGQIDLEHL